jgi:cytochrome P450
VSFNPAWWILHDIKAEWSARGTFPPGPTSFSLGRTHQMLVDPLHLLLDCYKEYGSVFSLRAFHQREVFMFGPEANHYITVSHADNFHWRESHFGDMIPLLGDGLLTIEGDYHRRARRIVLPAFHREQIVLAVETMIEETQRMIASWRPGEVIDVYHRARELTMSVAMRALLSLDPDDTGTGEQAAIHFERALSYYGTEALPRMMRGPGTPWRRMNASTRVLDDIVYGEITRRRNHPDSSRPDILSLLLEARDEEDGGQLSDREVRDQVITLMFAGHDTTASTITFLLYELARNPKALAPVIEEQDQVLGGAVPTAEQLYGGLPQSRWRSPKPCGCIRPPGSGRGTRSRSSSSPASTCPAAPPCTTPPGPAIACPRSSPTPTPSSPSASRPRPGRSCRAAPTFLSAAAPAPASGCALARSRPGPWRPCSRSASASS